MLMRPVKDLKIGQYVRPRMEILPRRHWDFASECADIGGGLTTSALLRIVQVSAAPPKPWVRLELPGRSPPQYLKVSGSELSWAFELVG